MKLSTPNLAELVLARPLTPRQKEAQAIVDYVLEHGSCQVELAGNRYEAHQVRSAVYAAAKKLELRVLTFRTARGLVVRKA